MMRGQLMGIFSKSSRSSVEEPHSEAPLDEAWTEGGDGDLPPNVQAISPVALRMQEKMRSIDNLKTRIGGLNRTFEQMSALAAESSNSIQLLGHSASDASDDDDSDGVIVQLRD
jgi:hypothetical protein